MMSQTRRRFLTTMSMAGAAGLAQPPQLQAAEGALETTTVRLAKFPGICLAPQFIAEQLLRAEGFTDIRYVDPSQVGTVYAVASGQVDIDSNTPWTLVRAIDTREPITVLAGVMVGCYELFAKEGVRSIADLKGRSVGVEAAGPTRMGFPFLLAANVGLDPDNDIRWVTNPDAKPLELFVQGKIDAFLAFPPEPQELRARKAGRVIFSTAADLPWSQYFCCMLAGNQDYVRNYPVATKRVVRAILKATDLCASEPARAAQQLVEVGLASRYDYALQTISELPYDKWREYEPEDTIRFYALRLHETGFVKSSPQKIITEGTDWRFVNELKRELKA